MRNRKLPSAETRTLSVSIGVLLGLTCSLCPADDWPMWRYDAARSGASPQQLPAELHLQWVRRQPPLQTAWLDQPKLTFDRGYEPVVLGSLMFVASSRDDTVVALDTRTGAQLWVFPADGPIRLAPAAADGKVYFACDDGNLYCVDAKSGKPLWKFRGGPTDRRVLGNQRLISTWPARGGPVVGDGTVYFAASIWPFMGIFLHALEADSGQVVWTNDGDGSMYIRQPHNTDSFAGVAPQGPLALVGDHLLIPGGRSVPACYDRATGEFRYYHLAENGKRGGGSEVFANRNLFVNGGQAFEVATGAHLGQLTRQVVLTDESVFVYRGGQVQQLETETRLAEITDRRGKKIKQKQWSAEAVWTVEAPGGTALIKAGDRFYSGGKGVLCAVDIPSNGSGTAVSWKTQIDGTPSSLLAADDRLFAVTLEGRIYCFGAGKTTAPTTHKREHQPLGSSDAWAGRVDEILEAVPLRGGYCVAWGVGSGGLIAELLGRTDLHVIVVEPDADKALAFRQRITAADLYGSRVSVHVGDPASFSLPPYLADLMVCENLPSAGLDPSPAAVSRVFHALRPFGGTACLAIEEANRDAFVAAVETARLEQARLSDAGSWTLLTRAGALPGSADWTHEHADAANTRVSEDSRVKAPLGLLWFGGSSNEGILPRHGHGPQPQVVDGRLFIEGPDLLRAVDVYTGRVLWEKELPGVGAFYNNHSHQPGANASGANYVSTPDGIYIAYGKICLRLDPETGEEISRFKLPAPSRSAPPAEWGTVKAYKNYLIGTGDPLIVKVSDAGEAVKASRPLMIWDVQARKLRAAPKGHTDQIHSLAFSADNKLLLTASGDRTARIWDVMTGESRHVLKGHKYDVNDAVFSPDGATVVTGSDDRTIKIWNAADGKLIRTLTGHTDAVRGVAVSPEAALIASAGRDETVRLWDGKTGKPLATLEGHGQQVNDVTFSPDGTLLASSSEDKTVILWDVARRKRSATLRGHRDHVNSSSFSPDGKTLVTGSCDHTVGFWDVATGKMQVSLPGHSGVVNSVRFTADGLRVVSGGARQLVVVWDAAERTMQDSFKAPGGGVNCVAFSPDGRSLATGLEERAEPPTRENRSSSKQLAVMDRHTGGALWSIEAHSGLRHNATCTGGDRLYCIDRLPQIELAKLKRRGKTPDRSPQIRVFDIHTGEERWSTDENVFGTWLSYSARHDVLVEAGRPGRDALTDEPKGIRVYAAKDGKVLWYNESYSGPVMIRDNMLLTGRSACDLLTGKPIMRDDPITGKSMPWTWTRNYGCNIPLASRHLLTFRSGAAGYFDLANDGGTGNFGGFRSSCTNNLIVANGVIAAADYTRACTCSYQNQSSVGLVHLPEAEIWTQYPLSDSVDQPLQTLGYNLGAPGYRRAPSGLLWLHRHERVRVTSGERFGSYNRYSAGLPDDGIRWVSASGCRGIRSVEIATGNAPDEKRQYTVRLHFCDPDNESPGRRVFDVSLQGEVVLEGFDIVRQAGARDRSAVKEFRSVSAGKTISLAFEASNGKADSPGTVPLLNGIEVVRED